MSINYQQKWDKWLIKGWYGFNQYGWVLFKFINEVKPSILSESGRLDYNEALPFFQSLDLKRCLIMTTKGEWIFPRYKCEVRALILERSKVLSACLATESMNRIEVLLNIDSFKWRCTEKTVRYAVKQRNEKKKDLRALGSRVVIDVINRDFRRDWQKTK